MRTLTIAFSAALMALAGFAGTANAGLIGTLVWKSTGTSDLTVGVGGITGNETALQLNIVLTATTGGVSAYGVSLQFDTDGDDELDLVAANERPSITIGNRTLTAISLNTLSATRESILSGQDGRANNFESASLTQSFDATKTWVAGNIIVDISDGNWNTDGPDIFLGLFDAINDGIVNADSGLVNTQGTFSGAALNLIPEPGTASLLGFGLLGVLAIARRRSKKS